jgi:uncharacterized protein (TIGR00251 family)
MKARVSLKVQAGARTTEVVGRHGEGWKLRVAAPPVDGKANDAIQRFFADLLGVPLASVRIVTGQTASNKILEIEGVAPDDLERAMLIPNGTSKNSGSPSPRKS